jgi:Zn-dependent protease
MLTFLVVLLGWLLSLSLHEFSHALVAYRGGDWTVKEKGYLDFDLFKYTHPVYSILLPMLFLVMGGIGLPGGAVYIETWRIRNRWWESAMSLAGPLSNLLVAIALGLVLRFDAVAGSPVGPGLAFLAFLQVSATCFNLLPIPPFDGFGILRPHLNIPLRAQMEDFGRYSMWVILLLFWFVPFVSDIFWFVVSLIASLLGVPLGLAWLGYDQFTFWR